jgi:hypothetical protein
MRVAGRIGRLVRSVLGVPLRFLEWVYRPRRLPADPLPRTGRPQTAAEREAARARSDQAARAHEIRRGPRGGGGSAI